LEQHKKQLRQRQIREAELERTIAELGTALTSSAAATSGSAGTPAGTTINGKGITAAAVQDDEAVNHYRGQWELAVEEVESLKGQFQLESQRSEALRKQLVEINEERDQEAASNQQRQRQYDQKIEEQSTAIARLEGRIRELQLDPEVTKNSNGAPNEQSELSAASVARLQKQLQETRLHISNISEQLLRQQGVNDVNKSEILALKVRRVHICG